MQTNSKELGETTRHQQAFELYYGMGTSRSLKKVAEAFDVHNVTIEKWSSKYKWQQRVKEADDLGEVANAMALDWQRRQRLLSIFDELINQFEEKVKNKEIKLESVSDGERLANIQERLTRKTVQVNQPQESIEATLKFQGMNKKGILIEMEAALKAIKRVISTKDPTC